MKIEQLHIRDLVQVGPLPGATMHQLVDELDARATALEMGGTAGTEEAARHIRSAIDELRIACSLVQAVVDRAMTEAS